MEMSIIRFDADERTIASTLALHSGRPCHSTINGTIDKANVKYIPQPTK